MARITIDKLAQMVANGFSELSGNMDKRFNQVELRLGGVEEKIDGVEAKVGGVELRLGGVELKVDHMEASLWELRRDVAEVKEKVIPPLEFEDLMSRVKYVEEKMGIESGK